MGDRPTEGLNKRGIFCIQNRSAPRLGTREPYRKLADTHSLTSYLSMRPLTSYSPFRQPNSSNAASPYGSTLVTEDAPVTHTFGISFYCGPTTTPACITGPRLGQEHTWHSDLGPRPRTHILMIKSIGYGCLFKGGLAQQKYRIINYWKYEFKFPGGHPSKY